MASVETAEGQRDEHGELRMVPATEIARLRGGAISAGYIFVEVSAPGPAFRGQLGEFIEAAIEEQLSRRGAAAPGVGTSCALKDSMLDQLYRAHHIGARGVVVSIGDMTSQLSASGALDPEDSAALAAWAEATRDLPVVMLIDRANAGALAYGPPLPLVDLLGVHRGAQEPAPVAAPEPPPATRAAAPERRPVEVVVDPSTVRKLADELSASKGPKPLPVVERMFTTVYVPLAEAENQGHADAAAKQVRAEWASSFARSYGEAFAQLRVTGKRPSMVFDVPQLAARIGRLHGARSVELFLVDGMRYDLGLRVESRLRRLLEGKAACAERVLLWSALPSTTPTQLDLIAHGQEALSRPLSQEDDESGQVSRGRAVTTARRVKTGARDLLKLDVVEARLREAGPPLPQRLDAIADEVSLAVVKHAESLAERTLLFVFGDHGFLIDATANGTGPARQGGASPEEILVPGLAFLVGDVH